MGKGKGKKGRREAKLAAKKATEVPKIPGAPRPANPVKKAKKLLSREKKSLRNTNPPGPENFPIPMGRPKPFTKSPQHAKWPALFKKHLGVIEAHIRSLDRVMQSMKSEMGQMEDKERMEWELGERGNWRVICEMMDRAREVLASAREAAKGILPSRALKDKKGLGVAGTNFEPLGPKLAERAAALGYTKKGKLGRDPDAVSTDSDEDTEMSDSADSSDNSSDGEDNVAGGSDFVPLIHGKNVPRFPSGEDFSEDKENKSTTNGVVEPNPYFVIDTNPTPVVLNGSEKKKSKKRSNVEGGEEKKSKKAKKDAKTEPESSLSKPVHPEPESSTAQPEVDFAALEASLHAEVEAKEKAQEAHTSESGEDKTSKKKRRRSSDGTGDVAEKKAKKHKSKKINVEEAPTHDIVESPAEASTTKESSKKRKLEEAASGEEVAEKKAKKDKKDKKRKSDVAAAEGDLGEGKKKRKHKSGSGSE